MKKFPVFLMTFVAAIACVFAGCTKMTLTIDKIEQCAALSTKLVAAFYNKEAGATLDDATQENFYVEITSDEQQTLSAITINNMQYKNDENINFSVGNNNFVETPVFKVQDNKLFVALPVLYVEAKGGQTKIEAGNRIYNVKVYDDAGTISVGDVGVFGETQGGSATKQTDSAGELIIKHARTSGKTFVGWQLTKNKETLRKDLTIYTKKYYPETNTIAFGVDVTLDAAESGYSSGLYNYYQNGPISEPKNRTIKYTVAVPTVGNVSFELQISETIPQS